MASFIMVTAVAMSIGLYVMTITQAREGSVHLSIIGKARGTEQRIIKFVESARAVGAKSNQLDVVMMDLTQGVIEFIDADGDPATLADNTLELDPDTSVASNETVLCDFVSPVPGEAMFQVLSSSPRTALLTFHVGERPPAGPSQLRLGQGYQGIEIRCAATPRNAK